MIATKLSVREIATATGFALILGTWVINIGVAAYEYRAARRLDSEYLAADDRRKIVIGKKLAERLDAGLGKKIVLASTTVGCPRWFTAAW